MCTMAWGTLEAEEGWLSVRTPLDSPGSSKVFQWNLAGSDDTQRNQFWSHGFLNGPYSTMNS